MLITGLALFASLALPAAAVAGSPAPVIFEKSRAIPTPNGQKVTFTMFIKDATRVRVVVDDGDHFTARKAGPGCGTRARCVKWRFTTDRGTDECYDLRIVARKRVSGAPTKSSISDTTVCEPFPDGEI